MKVFEQNPTVQITLDPFFITSSVTFGILHTVTAMEG